MAYLNQFRKIKVKNNLPSIRTMADAMYDKRVFCVDALHRKFSPVARFWKQDNIWNRDCDVYFGFYNRRLMIGGRGFYNYQLDGTVRVVITKTIQHGEKLQFEFNVATNKELLQKLLKYNLIE